MNKTTEIKSVKVNSEGNLEITAILDKKALQEEIVPYYDIKSKLTDAILPVLTEELLKHKKEIVKQVLKEVNWPDIVRSEVAQKIIKEISRS